MATKAQIKSVMRMHVEDCRDKRTGEINHTRLAEMASYELDLFVGHDYDIPELVFELATEFS